MQANAATLKKISSCGIVWQDPYFMIPNAYLYHHFGVIVSGEKQRFEHSHGILTAYISSKIISAIIEYQGSQEKSKNFGDITLDVLDIIAANWIRQASHPEETVWITVDDILRTRGIKPQKSGTGRRGGYKEKSRKKIAEQVTILADMWITILDIKVIKQKKKKIPQAKHADKSPAIEIVNKIEKENKKGKKIDYAWELRLGKAFADSIFGSSRQTALLSIKAVEYNHKSHRCEKRLVRYLSWIWRNRQYSGNYMQPFEVKTLLKKTQEEVNKKHPNRAKDRLEKALDTLLQDRVIAGWEYEKAHNEEKVGKKDWTKGWLQTKIVIEPPAEIFAQYGKIRNFDSKKGKKTNKKNKQMWKNLADVIESQHLNKLQASEKIGISVDQLTQALTGHGEPSSPKTVHKIQKWLDRSG